jgi:hypothetical protein
VRDIEGSIAEGGGEAVRGGKEAEREEIGKKMGGKGGGEVRD